MPRLYTLDDEDSRLALDILGTDDVAVIEQEISAFCREYMRQGVARFRYTSFSAGAGFGLVLDDGQSVFLKVCAPATSLTSLESVHVIQNALASRGFPRRACSCLLTHAWRATAP